jgi:hypothetical protein
MRNLFGQTQSLLVRWANKQLKPSTLDQRKKVAKKKGMRELFNQTTLVCDSADFRIKKQDNLRGKSKHHSYKLKNHGV